MLSTNRFLGLVLWIALLCVTSMLFGQQPELLIQTGHRSEVVGLTTSPDGRWIGSVDNIGEVKIWDFYSQTLLYSFQGVRPIMFTQDGRFLIYNELNDSITESQAVPTGNILIRSTHTWKVVDTIHRPLYTKPEDGKTDLLVLEDTLYLFSLGERKPYQKLFIRGAKEGSFQISQDGKLIAFAHPQKPLQLYAVETGEKVCRIQIPFYYTHDQTIRCNPPAWNYHHLRFSPNGNWLTFFCEEGFKIMDTQTGELIVPTPPLLFPVIAEQAGLSLDKEVTQQRLSLVKASSYKPVLDSVLDFSSPPCEHFRAVGWFPEADCFSEKGHLQRLKWLNAAKIPSFSPSLHPLEEQWEQVDFTEEFQKICHCTLSPLPETIEEMVYSDFEEEAAGMACLDDSGFWENTSEMNFSGIDQWDIGFLDHIDLADQRGVSQRELYKKEQNCQTRENLISLSNQNGHKGISFENLNDALGLLLNYGNKDKEDLGDSTTLNVDSLNNLGTKSLSGPWPYYFAESGCFQFDDDTLTSPLPLSFSGINELKEGGISAEIVSEESAGKVPFYFPTQGFSCGDTSVGDKLPSLIEFAPLNILPPATPISECPELKKYLDQGIQIVGNFFDPDSLQDEVLDLQDLELSKSLSAMGGVLDLFENSFPDSIEFNSSEGKDQNSAHLPINHRIFFSKDETKMAFFLPRKKLNVFNTDDFQLLSSWDSLAVPLKIEMTDWGENILLVDSNYKIQIKELNSAQTVREFSSPAYQINRIYPGPKGRTVVSGNFRKDGYDATIWDLLEGKREGVFSERNLISSNFAYDKQAEFLLLESIEKRNVLKQTVFDFESREKVPLYPRFGVFQHFLLSDDETEVYFAGGTYREGRLAVRGVKRGKNLIDFDGKPQKYTCFAKAGTLTDPFLLVGDDAGNVHKLNVSSGKLVENFIPYPGKGDDNRKEVQAICVNPLRTFVCVISKNGRCSFRFFKENKKTDIFFVRSSVRDVCMGPGGEFLYVLSVDGRVTAYEVKEDGGVEELGSFKGISGQKIESGGNGKFLILEQKIAELSGSITGGTYHQLIQIDTLKPTNDSLKIDLHLSHSPQDNFPQDAKVLIAFNHENQQVVAGGNGYPLISYDLKRADKLYSFPSHSASVTNMAFDPQGNYLITSQPSDSGEVIRKWDPFTGKRIATLGKKYQGKKTCGLFEIEPTYYPRIKAFHFGRKGDYVLLEHWNGETNLVNLGTGEIEENFPNQSNYFEAETEQGGKGYYFYRRSYNVRKEALVRRDRRMARKQRKRKAEELQAEITGKTFKKRAKGSSLLRGTGLEGIAKGIEDAQQLSEQNALKRARKREFPGLYLEDGLFPVKTLITTRLDNKQASLQTANFSLSRVILPDEKGLEMLDSVLQIEPGLMEKVQQHHQDQLLCLVPTKDRRFFFSSAKDSKMTYWSRLNPKPKISFIAGNESYNYMIFTPDNYYTNGTNSHRMASFRVGEKMFPATQFDLWLNRPDLVLSSFSNSEKKTIKLYKGAYHRRLKRMGLKENAKLEWVGLPSLSVRPLETPLLFSTEEDTIRFLLEAWDSDSIYLTNVYGYVNGVPLFGVDGIQLTEKRVHSFVDTVEVVLSPGENLIEFSVFNAEQKTSIQETFLINHRGEIKEPPELYFIFLGVGDTKEKPLQNVEIDLSTLEKEIPSLVSTNSFYKQGQFISFHNEEVNESTMDNLQVLLKNVKENDRVILFLTGHGETDPASGEYHFITAKYDKEGNPSGIDSITYSQIERMLGAIKCRNKLLLLNTCYSGDREMGKVTKASENFLVMKTLFLDLRRRSGTTVFAMSSGYDILSDGNGEGAGTLALALVTILKNQASPLSVSGFCDGLKKSIEAEQKSKKNNDKIKPEVRFSNYSSDFQIW